MTGILRSLLVMAFLLIGQHSTFAAPVEARGLFLYAKPPTDYVQAFEFGTLTSNGIYFKAVLSDGKTEEFETAGLIAKVDYPPRVLDAHTTAESAKMVLKIEQLAAKYPQAKAKLLVAQERWRNAGKTALASKPATPPPSTGIAPAQTKLTVNGSVYSAVELTGVTENTALVSHSDGVARISLADLTPDQIAQLNVTSRGVKIPEDWQAKMKSKDMAIKPDGATDGTANANQKPPTWSGTPKPENDQTAAKRAETRKAMEEQQAAKTAALRAIVQDTMVPPPSIQESSPSYAETIAFLEQKLSTSRSRKKIGYGATTKQLIVLFYFDNAIGLALTFDPKELSPEVKTFRTTRTEGNIATERGSVQIECSNGIRKISLFQTGILYSSGPSGKDSQQKYSFLCDDPIDAEKVAKAWSHLIQMFGGKADTF